jgi:hypothetical protein
MAVAAPFAGAFETGPLVVGPPIPPVGDTALGAAADTSRSPLPAGTIVDGTQTGQPPDILNRRSAAGDGTLLLLGDRVRAVVERAQPGTSRGVVGAPQPADQIGDATRYWLVADILKDQGLGVSAYGTYRPDAASAEGGNAGAGISIGLGDWRSWVEQREALVLDDLASGSLFPAASQSTLAGGMSYALRPAPAAESPLGEMVLVVPRTIRFGLSRSEALIGDSTGIDPANAVEESIRRAFELSFDWQWPTGTTTLRMTRSFAHSGYDAHGFEQTAKFSHRASQGAWRTEALFGYRNAQDEAYGWDTDVQAYEVGARFNYIAPGLPDLGGRMMVGYSRTASGTTSDADVDTAVQVTGTMGFAKFLPGAVNNPNRRVDLNIGFKGEEPDPTVGRTSPFDLSVGLNAGFRF